MKSLQRIFFRPETILLLLFLLLVNTFVWQKDQWQYSVLSSDGRGYYAYLPATILYQDFSYQSNTDALSQQLDYTFEDYYILKDNEGKIFNKYFPGVSICLLPLFLVATILSFLFGYEVNGYNDLYLIAIQLSAIGAGVIGFYYVKKLLIQLGSTVRAAIGIGFVTVFATNVFYYATFNPSMGHIYSFMTIASFLYFAQKGIKQRSFSNVLKAAFLFALVLLIRPTNGVVILLLAFFVKDWKTIQTEFSQVLNPKVKWGKVFLAVGVPLLIMPLLWYLQTGKILLWSYSGEGFYFLHPVPFKVLFGIRTGLFVYSPIAFIAMIGIWFLIKNNRFQATFVLLYFGINVYLISAWWSYYYGSGFGHRAFAEHQVFTAILLGVMLIKWTVNQRRIFWGVAIILSCYSVFQGLQMKKGILPTEYMDAEMYGLLFLKWDDSYIEECHATLDCHPFGEVEKTDYIRPQNFEQEYELGFDTNREFGGDAFYQVPLLSENSSLFLEYNYQKMRISETPFDNVFLIVEGKNKTGEVMHYEGVKLYNIRSEAFQVFKPLQITLKLPKKEITTWTFYIWNKGKQIFTVKDIDIRIHHIKA